FELNLGPDDESDARPQAPPAVLPGAFVTDVQERQVSQPKAPSAPTLRSKTGFPEHKKRNTTSRFRQKAQENNPPSEKSSQDVAQPPPSAKPSSGGDAKPKSWEEDEKQRIDDENRQKLAGMSEAEIEEERRELMNSMSPEFIQRLLKRSNIDSGSNESNLQPEQPSPVQEKPIEEKKTKEPKKSVKFADPEPAAPPPAPSQQPEAKPPKGEKDMRYVDDDPTPGDSIHFPQAPQPPDLDPNSTTFLSDLHEKYFPSLPADPDKLSWMQTSPADRKAYSANASAFNAQEIRFSFTGEILAPTTSHLIPVTEGLHHHGAAPDAAGYTIPELAHLSRSSYAAQRCIAFQTLGRILYRLGKGEFGNPGEPGVEATGLEDSLGKLARGLWGVVEHEKVIEGLVAESEGLGVDGGRHLSARAYATEAVWLWRKGGGRRWKAA
ncbi:hypothetical protein KC336_g3458, partial [Hortaea werneckii]